MPAKIKVKGMAPMHLKQWGMPSYVKMPGTSIIKKLKIRKEKGKNDFFRIFLKLKIKPIKNNIPTGQNKIGEPEILCRQL